VWAHTEAGQAGRDLTEARRRADRSSWAADTASGWRERRSHRREVAAWSEREVEALGRWSVHGEPEAARLDGLIDKGEKSMEELTRRRDRRSESLDDLHRYRNSSARTLGEFEQDIDTLRNHLDGIEPLSEFRARAENSVLRMRGGLDNDHDRCIHDHGIRRDLGHGLGR
jgi:hypothetical protein